MKRWLTIALAGAAVILVVLAILSALSSGRDNAKFVVGRPLPASRVAPQLVVASADQAVLLCPDGTLWIWGGSTSRPFLTFAGVRPGGPGVDKMVAAPQKMSDDTDWRQVAIASVGVAAVKKDGSLWHWTGAMTTRLSGQTNAPDKFFPPTRIGTDSNWVTVSGMTSHFMGLKADGSLWGWGQNESGQIGDGATNVRGGGWTVATPVMVGTDRDWAAISAGAFNSYALKKNGTLWGWGSDVITGSNHTKLDALVPEQIDPGTNWVAISAGDFHLIALKSDGTIWIRGQNEHITAPSTFASKTTRDQSILTQVGTDNDWARICSGQNSFFARKRDGSWWACGTDYGNHLGLGNVTNPAAVSAFGRGIQSPQRLPFEFDPWALATGGPTTVMLAKDGSLWSWGTRLGVSRFALEGKGIKGLYNKVVTWWQTKVQKKTQTPGQTTTGQRGRGGTSGSGAFGFPGGSGDTVIDLSPYRIWEMPSAMRKALEKDAAKSADVQNGSAH